MTAREETTMNASLWAVSLIVLAFVGCGHAQDKKPATDTKPSATAEKVSINFDDAITGQVPKGFSAAETKGVGTPATWRVEALKDDPNHKNAVKVDTKNKESVFNLLMSDTAYSADLELSAAVKAGTGEDDQGGGVLWRATDADNYYFTRWNPLEKNIRLYKVEKGVRTTLKSADVEVDPKAWHTIAVTHRGGAIVVKLDDKVFLEAEDTTFKDAGKVGFWTKADASSWFDDLIIAPAKK
jgi:hypothetical protein